MELPTRPPSTTDLVIIHYCYSLILNLNPTKNIIINIVIPSFQILHVPGTLGHASKHVLQKHHCVYTSRHLTFTTHHIHPADHLWVHRHHG